MDVSPAVTQDEPTCYQQLLELLHPEGLGCPECLARAGLYIHRRRRAPVLDYRCSHCGRVFNAWTGTPLQGTHRRPSEILLILRGIAQRQSTAQLARDLGCQRAALLQLRHRLERERPINGDGEYALRSTQRA
ncbi:MAG TPA: hypothetical protein VEL76_36435 [Gemmataceae bacterium]|nr:hypothetical protein [Gemmataceae bacterium]